LFRRVYLRHPRAFFALFDGERREKSSKSMFFHTNNSHSKQKGKLTLAETAFAFLQWAQHGNLPEIPDFSSKATAAATATSAAAAATTKIIGKEQNLETMLSDDDDNESGQDVELSEADFEVDSEEVENVKQPEWAKSVNNNSESDKSALLPEMEDPKGFIDSVALRPYQRQALYWMMKREQEGESREELEKELALLSELAASQGGKNTPNTSSAVSHSGLGQSNQPSIYCDCGPVLVSDDARKWAETLDGETSPVNHPLWKPRYLTNHKMDTAFLFYVNELLGVATCAPPAPPKQCSGGILADDMYVVLNSCSLRGHIGHFSFVLTRLFSRF
jgi:SNF2-related domain